jgi:glutamate racemase
MKIGVFDSGVGGLSVANAIREALPEQEVVLREDKQHVPYGTRPPAEILGFVVPIIQELVDDGCGIIVIACNTVSTTLIGKLREHFTVPFIGLEPMVKPAATLTKSKCIAVCATPTTLLSPRYEWLKTRYAQGITVLEPDCSDWSFMIEHHQVDEQKIADRINAVLEAGADIIVLGCTHYHWIEKEISELAKGRAEVLQPEQAVIKRLWRELEQFA